MKWTGKVAIITGASSGIGWHTALALSTRGVHTVNAARRMDPLVKLSAEIENKGTAKTLAVQTDVSRTEDVERLFAAAMKEFGRIDFLVNNAGSGLFARVEETTPEQMERLWRTNFMGTFYAIRIAVPILKKQGEGHILTVSSMAGVRGTPGNGAYCATKFAQIGLMDSLRRELAESDGSGKIHCTVVLPGATKTQFIEAMEKTSGTTVQNKGFVQEPAEVAEAIVHALERPSSRVITQKFGRTLLLFNALSPDFTDWLVGKTVR